MKLKSFIVASALTTLSASALAWTPVVAPVEIHGNRITTTVSNHTQFPMVCKGLIFGQLSNGELLETEFDELVVPPYLFSTAHLYSEKGFFVRASSDVYCR